MKTSAEIVAMPDATVMHAVDAVACDLGEETAILHLETGIYYGLDAVSSRIWSLLSTPSTTRQLVNALLAEYDVSRERCEAEVSDLLAKLAENRLIEIHYAAAA